MRALAILALGFVGCGELPEQGYDLAANDKTLEGTWSGICESFGEESEKVTLAFDGSKASITIQGFLAKDCDPSEAWYTKKVVSTYKAESGKLDSTVAEVWYTGHTAGEIRTLNRRKVCGNSNWKINVPVNVGELTCDGDDRPVSIGNKGYDIYEVKGDEARFGLNPLDMDPGSQVGRTPATRPTTLSSPKYKKS